MSNNSIFYKSKPTREQLVWHVKQMRYSGEPGFMNAEVAVSFVSLDNSFYAQMPYEAIIKKEYEKGVKEMLPFIPSLISKYEKEETEIDVRDESCSNGICPIR